MTLLLLALASSAHAREPRITSFELAPTTCAEWQLDVQATGRRRAVLTTDDMVISRWRPSQRPTYTRTGTAPPGTEVTYNLRVGGERETRRIVMPPFPVEVTPAVALFPTERTEHRLEVQLTDPCGEYSRSTVDARLGNEVIYGHVNGDRVTLVVPGQPAGIHPIELRFLDRNKELQHTAHVEFEVREGKLDQDGDGHLPLIAGGRDCDDTNSAVNPSATEGLVADGLDNDCSGIVDDGTTAYDDDGDGFSDDDGDCDDTNASIHPSADELWDCQDQDCDGEIDEGLDTSSPPADRYEPNNSEDTSTNLHTDDMRAFTKTLSMWVDGPSDIETFRFYSHDGLLDNWGIWVSATERGVGARYEVRAAKGERVVASTFDDGNERVSMSGLAGLEDSGTYTLTVRALDETSCPLTLRLRSN